MSDSRPLYKALFLIIVLAILHFAAVKFYFYWTYWWYDVVMHSLAGIIGGFATYWTLFSSGNFFSRSNSRRVIIWSVVILVFIAGVAWEIFEYKNGFTDSHEGYVLDTLNDLILDTTGALIAVLLSLRRRARLV